MKAELVRGVPGEVRGGVHASEKNRCVTSQGGVPEDRPPASVCSLASTQTRNWQGAVTAARAVR
jgi:hypothetical protein